ncbi:hypothetical protein COP2_022686 [Malus domestica]
MGCSTTQSWGIKNGSGVRYDSNQIAEENYSGILLCFLLCYGLLLLRRKPRKILLLVEKKRLMATQQSAEDLAVQLDGALKLTNIEHGIKLVGVALVDQPLNK